MDWGYIAGYFDGEGTAWSRAHGSGSAKCSLVWCNTHRESLEAMRDFMGVGRVRERKRHALSTKPIYGLHIEDSATIRVVLPHLIERCIIKRPALELLDQRLEQIRPRNPRWGSLSEAGVDEITRLYHDEGWTQQRIGEHFGVGQAAVKNFMRRHGIPARSHGDAARQAQRNSPAWAERNRKISEARKREWADPEERARRIARMRAGQSKRLATLRANREGRLADAA